MDDCKELRRTEDGLYIWIYGDYAKNVAMYRNIYARNLFRNLFEKQKGNSGEKIF